MPHSYHRAFKLIQSPSSTWKQPPAPRPREETKRRHSPNRLTPVRRAPPALAQPPKACKTVATLRLEGNNPAQWVSSRLCSHQATVEPTPSASENSEPIGYDQIHETTRLSRVLLSHEFRQLHIDLPKLPGDVLQCCRYSIFGRDVERGCPTDVGRNERLTNDPLPTFSTIAHLILLPPSCPADARPQATRPSGGNSTYNDSKSPSSSISAPSSSASGWTRPTPRVCGAPLPQSPLK